MTQADNTFRHTEQQLTEINALLKRYYDGLFFCDTGKLKSVFHGQASYATVTAGALIYFNMAEYLSVVDKRISPADRGDKYFYKVDSIHLAGETTASVQLSCTMLGKSYTDFLSLLRIDEEWRIIAKIFHAELISPPIL